MNNRWHKTVESASAAITTPMPWTRGAMRQAMIQRREAHDDESNSFEVLEQKRA